MNFYKKAMEILEEEQDWKAIVVEIAKNNPSKVVNAFLKVSRLSKEDQDMEIIQACRIGLVPGIKKCRELMGLNLKEAKAYCEHLCNMNWI